MFSFSILKMFLLSSDLHCSNKKFAVIFSSVPLYIKMPSFLLSAFKSCLFITGFELLIMMYSLFYFLSFGLIEPHGCVGLLFSSDLKIFSHNFQVLFLFPTSSLLELQWHVDAWSCPTVHWYSIYFSFFFLCFHLTWFLLLCLQFINLFFCH